MSDDKQQENSEDHLATKGGEAQESQAPVSADTKMPVMIHAQYIKDLSFENPHAPASLVAGKGRPSMNINFSMNAQKLENGPEAKRDLYEVVLGVNIESSRDEKVTFIIELLYGMTCSLKDVPEEHHHPMLLVEMPRYAFPFVRQIIANLTQDAGYMPLLLNPADFKKIYMQRYGQLAEEEAKEKAAKA